MADVEVSGLISKTDEDQRLVFGWANVAKTADGATVIDRQDDFWETIDELEDTAYDYVLHSRDGGDTHLRKGVSTLVESFVSTPEKLAALGLPADSLPQGWWVGFKVHDDQVWKGVKAKKYTGFSIGGTGKRQKGQTPVGKIAKDGSLIEDAPLEPPAEPMPVEKVDPLVAALHAAAVVKHLPGRHNQLSHGVDRMIADWKYVRDNSTDPARVAHAETQLKRLSDTKAAMESAYQRDGVTPPPPDQFKNTPVIYQPTTPEQAADIAARRKMRDQAEFDAEVAARAKIASPRLHPEAFFPPLSDAVTVEQQGVGKADPLMKALGAVAKHLQGQHDQKDHAGLGGKTPKINWSSGSSSSSSSSSTSSQPKPAVKTPPTTTPASKPSSSSKGDISGLSVNGVPLTAALDKISVEGKPDASGTADDPIEVGDDLDKAVRLLSDGKHVRLRQPSEVSTLLDKLAAAVNDAKEQGKDAPNIDLCKVSVPGTNLFCHDSKGIPRAKMPQFKGKARAGSRAGSKVNDDPDAEADVEPEFRAALDAMGIKVTDKEMPAARLRATQSELVGPKVAGMVSARLAGTFPDKPWNKPIYVTRDGYIIDGHHRWAAKVGVDAADGKLGDEKMAVYEVDMDIGTAIDFANAFALAMGITPKGTGADAEGVKKFVDEIRKARGRDTTPCFGCR